MRKDLLVRASRWTGLVMAVIIIFIAVVLTFARCFVVFLADHRSFIEGWASQVIHHPVRIGAVQANWKGLDPAIRFTNVVITKPETKKAIIQVKQLSIGIDLFHSLLQWQLLPGHLTIRGVDLDVYQSSDNKLHVSGLLTETKQPTELLSWLLTEADVGVEDVNLNWHAADGMVYPIEHIQLMVRNDLEHHVIVGQLKLKNAAKAPPTQVTFNTQLKDVDFSKSQFDADVYLKIKQLNLKRWAKEPWVSNYLKDIHVKSGLANLKLWMHWKQFHLASMQGVINAKRVATYLPSTKKEITINQLNANLAGYQYAHGWEIQADKIDMKMDGHVWPENHFGYRVLYDEDHVLKKQVFYLGYLRLGKLRELALEVGYWPEKLKQFFVIYHPKGMLKDIRFLRTPADASAFQVSMKFDGLGLDAYQQFPGVSNISGAFVSTLNSTDLRLDTKNASIFFPKYYSHPLPIDSLKAVLSWKKDIDGVNIRIPNYKVRLGDFESHGQFHVTVPKSGDMFFDVLAGLKFNDLSKLKWYLPDIYFSKKTYHVWSHIFKKGQLSDGTVLFRGPISSSRGLTAGSSNFSFFPDPVVKPRDDMQLQHDETQVRDHAERFEADIKLSNLALSYYSDWPALKNINAALHVVNRSVQASAQDVRIGGNHVSNLQASIKDVSHPVLALSGTVDSTFEKALHLFQRSYPSIADNLKNVSITGPLKLDMRVTIPFIGKNRKVHYAGKLYLQDSSVDFIHTKVRISNISGLLGFNDLNFYSKDLSAEILERPLKIKVLTLRNDTGSSETEVLLGGYLDLKVLQDLIHKHVPDISFLKYVSGGTGFRALMQLHLLSENKIFEGTFITDLKGVVLKNLPPIFDKASKQPQIFQIHMAYQKKKPIQIDLNYNKQVSVAFSLDHQFKALSGGAYFGPGKAKFQSLPGFVIGGRLPFMDWLQWSPYIMPIIKEQDGAIKIPKIFGLPLRYIEFRFGKFVAYHQALNQVYFKLTPRLHDWLLNLQSDKITGVLFFPSRSGGTWTGRFEHFYISKVKSQTDQLLHVNPRKIPPIDLVIQNFQYGKSDYGDISVIARPTRVGLSIKRISLKSPLFNFLAKGFWNQVYKKQNTFLEGYFQCKNLGQVLSDKAIQGLVKGGSGVTTFSLAWPGAPNKFSMEKASGHIDFNFHHGRLLQTKGASATELSLGRLLNVFSIQSLLRRLTLDFSDIAAEGLEFHTLKGEFAIKKGIASTKNAYLDGPVVKIKVKGDVNFLAKQYDLHLSVMPYVTSSLPLIIGVVGGPVAGAVAWVVNKIISPEIGKAVGFNYDVKASWDKTKLVKLPVPATTRSQSKVHDRFN